MVEGAAAGQLEGAFADAVAVQGDFSIEEAQRGSQPGQQVCFDGVGAGVDSGELYASGDGAELDQGVAPVVVVGAAAVVVVVKVFVFEAGAFGDGGAEGPEVLGGEVEVEVDLEEGHGVRIWWTSILGIR